MTRTVPERIRCRNEWCRDDDDIPSPLSLFPATPDEAPRTRRHAARAPERSDGQTTRRWLLPIRAGQVIVWEVAALAVIAALGHGMVPGTVADALAGAAFVLTSLRIGGLPLAQWLAVGTRYRRRRAAARNGGTTGVRELALAAMVPGLAIRGHVDRAGNRVGLAATGDGWSAVVRLATGTTPEAGVLLDAARRGHRADPDPARGRRAGRSGRVSSPETKRRYDRPERPVGLRIYWLALRYRPADAPQAALARGGGEAGAIRAAASAALGLAGALAQAGFPNTVLDEHELRQELAVALGAEPPADPWEALDRDETWHGLTVGTARQVCFSVRGHRGNSAAPDGHLAA